MYINGTQLTALAMGTSLFNWADQPKRNLQYCMLRKKTQKLNLFNLQFTPRWFVKSCAADGRWLHFFVIMFPGIFERRRNQLQVKTIDKHSNHPCPHHLINLYRFLFSAVKYSSVSGWRIFAPQKQRNCGFCSSQGRPGHQPTECWDHEAGASATDWLWRPSYLLMEQVLIWASWCKLTFGEFEILTFQVDSSWLLLTTCFFWGDFWTCGTCVREGVSSLPGTLQ